MARFRLHLDEPGRSAPVKRPAALVHRLSARAPDDTETLQRAIAAGAINPAGIIAILGKTEGNGCVNDFTRAFAVAERHQQIGTVGDLADRHNWLIRRDDHRATEVARQRRRNIDVAASARVNLPSIAARETGIGLKPTLTKPPIRSVVSGCEPL